ncbi:hypothetical protein ACROSR_04030, partial [Roseovarius tibetensis]|uniref:hypothetical protein n=1 Tax=Roseovarius tibetensis TaxID=2685897 RepID=UPI003D7FE505
RLCEDEPLCAIGSRTMASDERVQAFLNRPLEGLIRMNSVPRTEFPTVRRTVGAVNGHSSGSTPPT